MVAAQIQLLFLVPVFSKALFSFVGCDFMTLPFLSAWHSYLEFLRFKIVDSIDCFASSSGTNF